MGKDESEAEEKQIWNGFNVGLTSLSWGSFFTTNIPARGNTEKSAQAMWLLNASRECLLNHFAFNARKNKNHSQHQVLQRGNHPIAIYSPRVIRQKLGYVHDNPVNAKIVAKPLAALLIMLPDFRGKSGSSFDFCFSDRSVTAGLAKLPIRKTKLAIAVILALITASTILWKSSYSSL